MAPAKRDRGGSDFRVNPSFALPLPCLWPDIESTLPFLDGSQATSRLSLFIYYPECHTCLCPGNNVLDLGQWRAVLLVP